MTKTIESPQDFMNWANQVNHAVHQCDLQDEFAYSKLADLKQWFIHSEKIDRHLLIFSIQKNQGGDVLIDFLNLYARHKANEYLEAEGEEINKRWSELLQKESHYEYEKNMRETWIIKQTADIKELKEDLRVERKVIDRYETDNLQLESELEKLKAELEKYYVIDNHIRSLINK